MIDKRNHYSESEIPVIGWGKKGFTLIELMIVIAIIGIIAAIAVPQFMAYRQRAYDAQAQNDAKNFYKACVHSTLESQGLVLYWSASVPPGYTGMKPLAGWFAYHPSWGAVVFCNASFKHPDGKKTYMLNDRGNISAL